MSSPASVRWQALGTGVHVISVEPGQLEHAVGRVRVVLDRLDRACSRFRPDSELAAVNAAGERETPVSGLFARALREALRAAQITDGDLDPTIGSSIRAAGYERNFQLIDSEAAVVVQLRRAAGWRAVELDERRSTVRLRGNAQLDLGATAKALGADLAAEAAREVAPAGVLVNLGGDISIAGPPPPGGWAVRVCDDHAADVTANGQTIALSEGGLASSSTTVRRWTRDGRSLHHILDASTGHPAVQSWRTVSVAAASCLDANIASTTAILRGTRAPAWLERQGLAARLVAPDGSVTLTGGWPVSRADAAA